MKSPEVTKRITMSQDLYDKFNDAITLSQGVTFKKFAEEQPTDAYKLLTRVMEGVAQTAESIISDDGIEVTKKMDGETALAGFAKHTVKEVTRDTDIESFDVVVSVFQKLRFRDFLRGRETEPRQVFAFHVEPPNLAF